MKTLTTILAAALLAMAPLPALACSWDLNGVGYPPECGYRGGGGGGNVAPQQPQHPYVAPTSSRPMDLSSDVGEATRQLNIMAAFAMREHDWARAMVIYQQAADYSPNDASITNNYRLAKHYQDTEQAAKRGNRNGLKDALTDVPVTKAKPEPVKSKSYAGAAAASAPAPKGEASCPPAGKPMLSKYVSNSARYGKPGANYCAPGDSVPCASPYQSYSCPAGKQCNGDGSTSPLCR